MRNQICKLFKNVSQLLKVTNSIQLSVITTLLCLVMGSTTVAQTLGQYQFNSALGVTCLTLNKAVTAQPANAVFSDFSNVGGSCVASTTTFINTGWNTSGTIDLNNYNTFSITPNAGYAVTLTSLTFRHVTDKSATSWVLRSSVNGYSSNIATGTITTSNQTPVVALPAALFTNVTTPATFRLYVLGAQNANTIWSNENVSLAGTVNPIPANPANPTSNSPQCNPPGVTLTRTGTPPGGITWYWQTTPTGTSITSSGATYNVTTSGTYYLSARNNSTQLWSSGAGSLAVVVTPNVGATAFILGASSTRCQGTGTLAYTASASNAAAITYTLDATSTGAGNTINAATGNVTYTAGWSGGSIITATASGCGSSTSATHTVTTTPFVTTPSFTLGATTTRCQGAGTVTYTASANNTSGLTYSLDAASISGGNIINASTGAVTYAAGWSGTTTITVSAAGCSPKTATHTVMVTATVGTPVFASGGTSSRCQAAGIVSYSASATSTTGITYALDPASIAGGNSINSTTGDVLYAATWAGTSTITASAASVCGGPKTATHVVTISAPVATPIFTLGASSTRCQGSGAVVYTANAAYTTGITYTLDLISSTAGNSINAGSGTVTYVAGWTGNSTITASAAGCYGPQSSSHTVTTTSTVGSPAFLSGASSTRCQGAGTVNYFATATNTNGITYSLDGASIAGGNIINNTTGDVTYAAGWSGTTLVTASAAGCNGPRTSTHTVSVTATVGTPVFVIGATSTRCQQAEIITYTATASGNTGITYSLDITSIAGGNTIDAGTGSVNYAPGWYGTSVITATASGCNGPSMGSHTVITNQPVTIPVFLAGSTSTICQNPGTVTYTASADQTTGITYTIDASSLSGGNTIDVNTGAVIYNAGWSGSTVITASAAGCFGPLTATHNVTLTPTVGTPVFSMGSSSGRCQKAETITYSSTATTTTGITYSLDGASIAAGNSIDPATGAVTFVDTWFGTSVITASAEGCNGPVTSTHTVVTSRPVTVPVFAAGASTIRCQGAETITYAASSNYTTGITYSLDASSLTGGNSINATTGTLAFAATWSGTSVITASAAGCYGPQTATHTITITPTVGAPVFAMGATSTHCQGAIDITYNATATTNTSISYSLDGASITGGNTINSVTGEVTFSAAWSGTTIITASATGCNGPSTSTHTVSVTATVGTPIFLLGATSIHCQDLSANTYTYSATATTNTGITYNLDAASIAGGNSINSASGVVTFVSTWTGTSIITAIATGCNGPTSATHTVTITPSVSTPVFDLGSGSVHCQGISPVTYAATANNTTGITYTLDAASRSGGNSINVATGEVTFAAGWSGTSTVKATATGCNGPKTANHVITITPTVGLPFFALGATSSRCHAAVTVNYSATATNTTGITYSLDASSLVAGNTINSSTGAVTYLDAWEGTSIITSTATGCNGPRSSSHTVITNGSVSIPVFTLGSNSIRCQGAGTVDYTATANNTTAITYALDITSRNAGNTINTTTGRVTYVAGWSGTSTIVANAAGCYGPQTSTHTVTITPTVGTPVFTIGSTSTRCQGAAVITYDATATTNTGITYSLNAASISGGNIINAATGEVTFASSYSGTTIITTSATGCNGPRTATHTVTVTASVGTPVFTLGLSSTRCQASGNVNYFANATTNTGITYTLDAASTAAGNFINVNGRVTYTASWSGTSVITATATGCNGPTIASHTVTITPTVGFPVFDLGASSTRCQGANTVTYTASATNMTGVNYALDGNSLSWGNTINSATGVVTYMSWWYGSSTITATASGCNGPRTTNHSVTTIASVGTPVFAAGSTSSRCHATGAVNYSASATTTTGITYTLDATSLAAGNTINPVTGNVNYVDEWEGTSVITASAAGCGGPKTATHTVTSNGSVTVPVFALGSTSVRCQGAGNVNYTSTSNNTTGITYTLDFTSRTAGNTINAATGTVAYTGGWSGTSTITATAAGCYGPQTSTHSVTITPTVGQPVFSIGASSTRCQGAAVITYNATATTTTGITYSLNASSTSAGNTINASTGEVTYTASYSGTTIVTASAAGCNGPVTSTHTVTVNATVGPTTFSLGATSTRCQGAATITYTSSATTRTGVSYALDNTSLVQGNLINTSTGAVTYAAGWSGTSIITATSTGCNGPTTANHTVTITPTVGTPVFTLGSNSSRCKAAGTVTYSATATNTTGITYSLDFNSRVAGNTINAATGTVAFVSTWNGISTITANAAGCNGPDIAFHTVTTNGIVATPVFTSGASSTRCQGAGTVVYMATATNNMGLTYSLDATSIAAGNSINAATGAVTYTAAWTGASTITVSAAGCGGPATASHTATTTATSPTPVFTLGASSSRCNGAGTVTYTATASTAITYSIDAASIAGGNTINSSTGVLNYATGWIGTTTITATAAGCGTPTATHSAVSTPNVAAPTFTMGATSSRCQGAGSTTYTAVSGNATGISYSLDAASLAAGNTIVAATGQVTFVATWNGTSVVTATATGCNGPATSTHTITISGNGTPAFDLGSSSNRMQAATTVLYNAVANNGSAVTYSLDAASRAGGNTINTSTGVVTWSTTWSGNSIITASAVGCGGPVSSTHSVLTTPNSVFKELYLSDPAQSLDRIDPVATADATTANTGILALSGKVTFTQAPSLCSVLIIKTGRNITITTYVTINSGTMPANPNITAVLRYGATTFVSLNNPTYAGGLLTWTTSVPADVTIPAGQAIAIDITNNQNGVSFTVLFDSQTKPSKIQMPVSTFINIVSLDVYNAPYPGGSIINGSVAGNTNYIRAVVTDPFGFNDITALNVTITPTGTTAAATSVATSGCTRTYQYVWNSPASASYIDIMGVAKEGYENTVTSSKNIAFSNCVDCPPIALNDSAVGAGGTPITIDVLANDTDPNNNLNPAALTVVVAPQNGNVFISNGKIIYLPNGTFTGTDQFTYQICDLTSPTPLCASATVKVDIDPTIVDPCGETSRSHTYYVPYPEQDARTALIASTNAAFLPIPSNNIRTILSIKVPYPGMVITWDHWEDGYEASILNPSQASTRVWGDGNPYNGIAPGYPNDILPAGASIVFDNTMPANPRVAANIYYDGRDKIQSTGEISVTQVLGEPSIIGLQSMKTPVSSTTDFGKSFTIPVGQDFNSQDFRYTALFIRASENNTIVNIDKDNNGTFETTALLNEGQSLLINGGVMTGATITGSAPIGVDLHFGGVDGYSSREVPIFPATWYSNVYYTPVPTTSSPDSAVVMLYNSLSRPITINWSSGVPTNGTITLPPKTVKRFPLALLTTSTYKFVNPTGEAFTAIEIVDSYTPGGGGNSGSTFDWAFNLIAEERLTTFATIAWAPGSTDGSRNDNPIWVTPAANTTVYVKYNGNILTGGSVSPCGLRYDVSYTLNALKYKKIFDTDNDQSGIAIYTCDGTKIAAVYGEDPSIAANANPSWDVGLTIKPYCATKLVFANDDYAYSLTDRAVTIQVLSNDAGFIAVIDPSTVTVSGGLQPKHGTVKVNANGTLLYTPYAGYTGLDSLEYTVCSTPSPVCDKALVIININACPTPANQNIISGQVFLDKNKDGVSNDGSVGYTPAKIYLYADGNCNGVAETNELKDSIVVDSSGSYQFITYPERVISDDFDNAGGTTSCAAGSDGTATWATNWVDAGDASVGFCVTPALTYGNTDVEMIKDGLFSNAIRLKDRNKSATRTININGSSAAFLSFSYRRAKNTLIAGKDIYVQASGNGVTFSTIFTISGDGSVDAGYVNVSNLDILPYASANTYIRFLTNNNLADADEVFIDDVSVTYLKFPICYITRLDPSSISTDYYTTTITQNAQTAVNGGTCLFPFDFGVAKKFVTVTGALYHDANGLTDNLVNGTATGAPSGNTVYAYLTDSIGKILYKTTVNSLSGAYSFIRAEVNTKFFVSLSTSDVTIGSTRPSSANLPAGWVAVGDSYGTFNNAGMGNEAGTPDLSIALNVGLNNITGVNFGINQRPTAGNGTSSAINPGGTINLTLPPATFSNGLASSDPSPGVVSSILISAFPTFITSITINGTMYTAATFPVAGVLVPVNALKQPTQTFLIDPVNGMGSVVIPFYAVDNAGTLSSLPGTATLQLLIDTDKDGITDNIDIDDDNDGIPDVIEICGNGATSFACAPGGKDPSLDNDGDGIVNWQDADYGPLNANGANVALDRDGDGIPDFLDLDSDNDGVPDVVEAYGVDTDGNGIIDNFTDTDGDGLSQNVDGNNTGAAGSGVALGFVDLDGDGIPNSLDLDSDNDGIPDILEVLGTDVNNDGRVDGFVDTDGDGLADTVDGDADGNGTIENINGPLLKTGPSLTNNGKASNYPTKNADYTGKPNLYDLDSDGDGIADVIEAGFPGSIGVANGQVSGGKTNGWANSIQLLSQITLRNSDGRGPANYLDIDSDDDGITDNIEAQSTNGYKLPSDTDTDGDGIADVYEVSSGLFGANGLTPFDNDGDGTPDYMDTDTDNDGAPDINEASRLFNLTQANINTADLDGDGLIDEFDMLNVTQLLVGGIYRNMTNSNFGALGVLSGPTPSGSNVKMVKSAASMTDRDWRNIVVLPLQIVSFTGTYQNNMVTLQWVVKNEGDVSEYEIERSPNGIDFTKIAAVKALNRQNNTYTYADDISLVSLTNVYYRIRQVEKTGETTLTNVIRWKIENSNEQPVLYPNPVQSDLKIKYFSKVNGTVEVMISDAKGQPVSTAKFSVVQGSNILTLPRVGSMSKGSYMLRFHSGLNTWMLRFLVQ